MRTRLVMLEGTALGAKERIRGVVQYRDGEVMRLPQGVLPVQQRVQREVAVRGGEGVKREVSKKR